MSEFTIRRAGSGDGALVLALLRELADYENLLDRFALTPADVARDITGPSAVCHCALAFCGQAPAGIATWLWTYKTFAARRSLYVEDLYVRADFRGRGLGRRFLGWLAATALSGQAAAMEWQVLDWNTASIGFYESLGARPVTDWIGYRLTGGALAALAEP